MVENTDELEKINILTNDVSNDTINRTKLTLCSKELLNIDKVIESLEEKKRHKMPSHNYYSIKTITYTIKETEYIKKMKLLKLINNISDDVVCVCKCLPINIKRITLKNNKFYIKFMFQSITPSIIKNIKLNYKLIFNKKSNNDIDPLLLLNNDKQLRSVNKLTKYAEISIKIKKQISDQHNYYKEVYHKITPKTTLPYHINREKYNRYTNKIEINEKNIFYNIVKNDLNFKDNYLMYINYEQIMIFNNTDLFENKYIINMINNDGLKFNNKKFMLFDQDLQ